MQTLVSAEKYYIFPVYHLLSIYVSLSNACFLSHREGNDLITRALGLIQSYNKSCGSCVKWLLGWLQHKDIQSFDSNTDIFPEYVNFNINNPKILEIFVAILFIYIFVFIYKSIFSQDLYFWTNFTRSNTFLLFYLGIINVIIHFVCKRMKKEFSNCSINTHYDLWMFMGERCK